MDFSLDQRASASKIHIHWSAVVWVIYTLQPGRAFNQIFCRLRWKGRMIQLRRNRAYSANMWFHCAKWRGVDVWLCETRWIQWCQSAAVHKAACKKAQEERFPMILQSVELLLYLPYFGQGYKQDLRSDCTYKCRLPIADIAWLRKSTTHGCPDNEV